MSGPSKRDLAGHHLTEAIRHLHAAAEFARETDHDDARELAMVVERAAEIARDVRGEFEPKRK